MPYALPALVTCFALILMLAVAMKVGGARRKYNIHAPATTGNSDFERVFRVHMNTLENVVIFLPAMWLFAMFLSAPWAAAIGTVWIIGRVLYAMLYYRAANKRGLGFMISFLATLALILGAMYGIVSALLH